MRSKKYIRDVQQDILIQFFVFGVVLSICLVIFLGQPHKNQEVFETITMLYGLAIPLGLVVFTICSIGGIIFAFNPIILEQELKTKIDRHREKIDELKDIDIGNWIEVEKDLLKVTAKKYDWADWYICKILVAILHEDFRKTYKVSHTDLLSSTEKTFSYNEDPRTTYQKVYTFVETMIDETITLLTVEISDINREIDDLKKG